MRGDGRGRPAKVLLALSAASVMASVALASALRPDARNPASTQAGPSGTVRALMVDFLGDTAAKQEMFNKGLPLTVDQYTKLQRVDYKKGLWTFHFLVSYYITRVKEFEDKKHATTISRLCMDATFVQSLKDSGPFLYQYLDPSGQTADVVIPKDDCGE